MSESVKRQRFTKEFKEDAIRLVLEQGYSCKEVARRLGIASSNLTRWVREHRDDQQQRSQTGKTHRERAGGGNPPVEKRQPAAADGA